MQISTETKFFLSEVIMLNDKPLEAKHTSHPWAREQEGQNGPQIQNMTF